MYKIIFLLFAFSNISFSMKIPHGEVNEISKNDVLMIIKQAEKYGIKPSAEINNIRSWRNGRINDVQNIEYVSIEFKPHVQDEYYNKINTLSCQKSINKGWNCENKENIFIRFDKYSERNILVKKINNDLPISLFIEVARAANNLRPMTWKEPITMVYPDENWNYSVIFGTYAKCQKKLTIKRNFDENGNTYRIMWEKIKNINNFGSCSIIGGYIDIEKMYIVFENNKWISE